VSTGQSQSTFILPGMDCPAEEQLVRFALADVAGIEQLDFDLDGRRVNVVHEGAAVPVLGALTPLGLGARLDSSVPLAGPAADREPPSGLGAGSERRVLVAVLGINAAMFVIELLAGLWAQSTGLVADGVDMLADASVYAVALAAVGGAHAHQRRAARASGWLQLALAALVGIQVVHRALTGSEPVSAAMMAIGVLALVANLSCVVLLARHRRGGMHLRASWIFTTNDALANLGVIIAGLLVAFTGSAVPDLVVGAAIAVLVASGALRILRMTSSPQPAAPGA
jgi:copper chaperone CopZ